MKMRIKIFLILVISTGFCFTMNSTSFQDNVPAAFENKDSILNTDYFSFTEALEYVDSFQTYSFMVLYKGQTVCEKYFRNYIRYDLINSYSMAKSYMSAILGIAIKEKRISLNDRVSDYVKPPLSGEGINAVNELRVRHLATMTSGLDYNWYRDYVAMRDKDNWLEFIQTLTIKYTPGTKWEYSVDPDLLSAVLEKAVGMPLWKYAEKKLLNPIGITELPWVRRRAFLVCAITRSSGGSDGCKPARRRTAPRAGRAGGFAFCRCRSRQSCSGPAFAILGGIRVGGRGDAVHHPP